MNKVVIYGAGAYGKVFYDTIIEKGLSIDYFIDEYTIEKDYNFCPIFKLRDIINEDFENIDVYISISLNNIEEIKINLLRKGYKRIYTFFESINTFLSIVPNMMKTNILWMKNNQLQILQSNSSKIQDFKDLLSDSKSIKLLEQIIKFRTTLEPKNYIIPDHQIQYFPTDIKFMECINSLKFIDCGAFIGDTIPLIMKNHNNISLIVSFEPDTKNIISLTNEINKQKKLHPDTNFLVYSCGVWDKTEILQFSADGSSSSSINNAGSKNTISISVTSLDESVYGCFPNYIKMDVEGAEQEAIKGAKNIIKDCSPILAIYLYHKPADLWEIPLLINSINPNYDMHIRVYGHMLFETVLYCVPKGFKCENIN